MYFANRIEWNYVFCLILLDLSRVHTIERVKFGIQHPEKNYIHLKDIKMWFMQLHSTILMGKNSLFRKNRLIVKYFF